VQSRLVARHETGQRHQPATAAKLPACQRDSGMRSMWIRVETTMKKKRKMPASHQVPAGWTDVSREASVVPAPDTYVDGDGVLRSVGDDSCVVWHSVIKERDGSVTRCERRGITPEQITYDPETGAPWCPDCFVGFAERRREAKWARIMGMSKN